MNPAQAHIGGAAVLAVAMPAVTTAVHYEALKLLARIADGRSISRRWVVGLLTTVVGLHLTEVALYAVAYRTGVDFFALGTLSGGHGEAWLDAFYFAAQTYSTLGYGDLVPLGPLRLVASVEALNGLLLIAWSGAFLFGVLEGPGRSPSERAP